MSIDAPALAHWFRLAIGSGQVSPASEPPIREELFGVERLEQHAESLAAAQHVARRSTRDHRLERRLADNERALRRAYLVTLEAARDVRSASPAADWLADNFHVVQEQVRAIQIDLPPGYHKQLPRLIDGPFKGYPRVFGLSWAFVAHTDSRFDVNMLCHFLDAYQRVQPLTIGELWAVAITLRVVLVENLRRLADAMVIDQAETQSANAVADQLLGPVTETARLVLARVPVPISMSFGVQLARRLRQEDPGAAPALRWLDTTLASQSETVDEIVDAQQKRHGAANVTIRNIITSMRQISSVDWRDLFEAVSPVDAILRAGSNFAALDFATREQYRHAIEALSRKSRIAEVEIAQRVIAATGDAPTQPTGADFGVLRRLGDVGISQMAQQAEIARSTDPGHVLIGRGRLDFATALGIPLTLHAQIMPASPATGIAVYIAAVCVITCAILAAALTSTEPGTTIAGLALLALLGLTPASDAAVTFVNSIATRRFTAARLPGLELKDGVPASLRTMVAMPTLLASPADIAEQVGRLEVHHLASDDGDLCFALLSDWTDSDAETMPGDAELLALARAGIDRLNQKYGPAPSGPRFHLFHRTRLWNPGQVRWMGWERKRGKLHELNRLLRGATDTGFGNAAAPADVRYVIVLDADTRLPRDAARRLIGKMAHPLNRPALDPAAHRVVDGYAILQPRVTPSMPTGEDGSLYQRVFASAGGMDPYAFAISDIYQDLFDEGSYTGKGIYDVDMFELALAGRIQENTVLSHDLLEGIFARAGLASDIEVIDEAPTRYDVATSRQYRWARGDWQLLPWILGWGTAPDSDRRHRMIPMIGRWKMIDNIRRSLSAPAALLALLAGWLLPTAQAFWWTLFVLATMAMPAGIAVMAGLLPRRRGSGKLMHVMAVISDVKLAAAQAALLVAFLPHQSWTMLDAAIRTVYRLTVSHRDLLEWVTAAQAKSGRRLDLAGFGRQMTGGLVVAVAVGILVLAVRPGSLVIAGPFVLLWLLAPAIALFVSKPSSVATVSPIDAGDRHALRLIARRTWSYFETFVTAEDNMLPPDNFQEEPKPIVAHRTSPTNMGLYLLSVVAAQDFGWIGPVEAVERLEATMAAMGRLERHLGHFTNWYDTRDLRPLEPQYISSVDSGNLAGHLVALWNALEELAHAPLVSPNWRIGVEDPLALLRESSNTLHAALGPIDALLRIPAGTPSEIAALLARLEVATSGIEALVRDVAPAQEDAAIWAAALHRAVLGHRRQADDLAPRIEALCATARAWFHDMKFDFLFEPTRELLSIGYRVADGTLEENYYDLLASEARLASFVAIAKGELPVRHWFRLGRAMTPVGAGAALTSWSGSMFEYLMPSLVMWAPPGSLLEQTSRRTVRAQISYGAERSVPWGASESAYNARDLESTYQYSSFGIPALSLKRGIGDSTVIAPYATALASMIDPKAAVLNFARMAAAGGRGRHGWYEALDYTRARLPEGAEVAVVQAYMAHYQGMSVVAIAAALGDGAMRRRFHAEPMIQATELLLQERMPHDVAVAKPMIETLAASAGISDHALTGQRSWNTPHSASPRTHLLSNGRTAVMLTAAGSGYTRWRDMAITRWQEDTTRDDWGSHVLLRDRNSGRLWSAGYQPTGTEPDRYQVSFSEGRGEITRRDGAIATVMEVAVSSEDDAEVRRISITNHGGQTREIEVTSYAELVLASQAADDAHPAFSKMFVETEFVPEAQALLATRRRRAAAEPEIWVAHIAVVQGETVGEPRYETDRARFIGRGRTLGHAAAVTGQSYETILSNTTGTVLDPIFALRRVVRLKARSTARIAFWTMMADTREEVLNLVDRHQDVMAFDRATTLAWTQAQVQLRYFGLDAEDANLFQRVASRVIYSGASLRPSRAVLARGGAPVRLLWQHGISGDLPIVLARVSGETDLDLVRQLLSAHEYWRTKQLSVDLVILNEQANSYAQAFQAAIEELVGANRQPPPTVTAPGKGAITVLRADLVAPDTRALLLSAARAVFAGSSGSLAEQLAAVADQRSPPPPRRRVSPGFRPREKPPLPPLEFFNGTGGFAEGGREYITILDDGQTTPAPWLNVVGNADFGFQVSAEGSGSTWSMDSQQNHLTPWSNDPVRDPPGEAFYVRDEETGDLWGPTALPIREASRYVARHGQGYSRFEHEAHGIALDLLQFVPLADPVKISRLTLTNRSGRARRVSVTAYVEWVLGRTRAASSPFIATAMDPKTGAMFARNPWSLDFGTRVAFADLRVRRTPESGPAGAGGRRLSWTGDRREFIGRNGTLDRPLALAGNAPLSNTVGAGFDPCGAWQTRLELQPGQSAEIVFLLGETATQEAAQELIARIRAADLAVLLAAVTGFWDDTLGMIEVKTPDRSMDIMLNRWLLYQTLACRVWARAAFYQASGAYGFRDQLQDVMALCVVQPGIARAQLLRAAARQFLEGDVQHWWLPASGSGIRTRISDDRVWLGFVVSHYIEATGDVAVLQEMVPFLEGPVLQEHHDEAFFPPAVSDHQATLYEHCALALDNSLALGAHRLPLMGTGDWNDGMNRVGEKGRGESVWLGWLLHATLTRFSAYAEPARATVWRQHCAQLQLALDNEGWDGGWYRRAYFDDGTPLGSHTNDECRIDGIAQSWSVISGAGAPAHAAQAMAAVRDQLVREDDQLVLLFTPPFDKTALEPGYIKGYPPGIRENGGQYTHGAIWSVIAMAMLGDGDAAQGLFALINPINHAATPERAARYRVEPYVVAADIYGVAPHVGRGGWTWYTGSAGWLHRAGLEWILGFRVLGARLVMAPCIPRAWPGFEIAFRHRSARYEIVVTNPAQVSAGIAAATLDGVAIADPAAGIALADDGQTHRLAITMG